MKYGHFLVLLLAANAFQISLGKELSKEAKSVENTQAFELKISEPINKNDWAFFQQSGQAWRSKLWADFSAQGKALSEWSWSWRIAWVRTCARDPAQWCQELIRSALYDHALVVRAKAAQVWGERFAGSENPHAVEALVKAYHLTSNRRHNKPLFIQERILFAIKIIAGEENLKIAKGLAAQDASTEDYWNKLR